MKRILVADDERPAIEGLALILKRDFAGEFELAGTASSGREAIESAAELAPDIVLMDVRMPGISGLEAIREMRRRGATCAFVLVTAYERFEIAREAVELGVIDYILKPVTRDRLAPALRAAAAYVERRTELDQREIEHREREASLRSLVESAFLSGMVLGEDFGESLGLYREALGLRAGRYIAGLASFMPCAAETAAQGIKARADLHRRFREFVRYKTDALAGPLFDGRCALLIPAVEDGEDGAERGFVEVLRTAFHAELARNDIALAFGPPRPIAEAAASFREALRAHSRGDDLDRACEAEGRPFEDDVAFLEALFAGRLESARCTLERLLDRFAAAGKGQPARAERYRLATLFAEAYRTLARRGRIDRREAACLLDLDDLVLAQDAASLSRASHARLSALEAAASAPPRFSPAVAHALSFIRESYGRQIGLEQAAEAAGLSPSRLSRLFIEETGRAFTDYLIDYRIARAKELLAAPGASVKAVSLACGYPDPNYFSRLFKKATGLTPSAFADGAVEGCDV